jgi:hypothetical protein
MQAREASPERQTIVEKLRLCHSDQIAIMASAKALTTLSAKLEISTYGAHQLPDAMLRATEKRGTHTTSTVAAIFAAISTANRS